MMGGGGREWRWMTWGLLPQGMMGVGGVGCQGSAADAAGTATRRLRILGNVGNAGLRGGRFRLGWDANDECVRVQGGFV